MPRIMALLAIVGVLERIRSLFMEPVAPPRRQVQGANRKRAGGPVRICNAADAALAGQPFGQGSLGAALVVAHLAQATGMGGGARLDCSPKAALRAP